MPPLRLTALVLLAMSAAANAQAVAAPGTDGWCAGFGTTSEGVFFHGDGSEAMVFRAGVDGDTGCYAWLSYVEAWGLVPGATLGTAERRGDRDVITFPNGVEVHLIDGGAVEHHSQNGVTPGQLR